MSSLTSVTITAANADELVLIVRTVLAEGLAASANIFPSVDSYYLWRGEVHNEPEALAIIHTRTEFATALVQRISQLHPYATPQIHAHHAAYTDAKYASWVSAALSTISSPAE